MAKGLGGIQSRSERSVQGGVGAAAQSEGKVREDQRPRRGRVIEQMSRQQQEGRLCVNGLRDLIRRYAAHASGHAGRGGGENQSHQQLDRNRGGGEQHGIGARGARFIDAKLFGKDRTAQDRNGDGLSGESEARQVCVGGLDGQSGGLGLVQRLSQSQQAISHSKQWNALEALPLPVDG